MSENDFSQAFRRREQRSQRFKQGIDPDDARRKREDNTIQIRKNKRDAQIEARRRNMLRQRNQQYGGGGFGEAKAPSLNSLIQGIHSGSGDLIVECVTNLRKLLSIERDPPIQAVIDSGIVPTLVSFLRANNNHVLQFESAWALTNIASGTAAHTRCVIDNHATPLFVELLKSHNIDVAEQAVWALGNIAGDSPTCRDLVLGCQAMENLLSLLKKNSKLSMLRTATWTLSNFCRGKPQPSFHTVAQALPVLAGLIHHADPEVVTDACWALSYISDDNESNNRKIQMVVQVGVCKQLVQLLQNDDPNIQTPALRTVGNIVTGDDGQTQAILNVGALRALGRLLHSPQKNIQKEACWTISNITAGIPRQIQAVLQQNLIPMLLHLLKNAHFDVRKEAAWAISNATSGGNPEQIQYLVKQGCIPPLCELFQCPDVRIITVAMEGIENILRIGEQEAQKTGASNKYTLDLEECGGLDMLEDLQRHPNEKIYSKAMRILQSYFEDDDDQQDTDIAPQNAGNSFQFSNNQNNNNGGGFQFN